ncbi:MAG: hypothetical protein PHR83_11400 [Paludibacter sp.]|nr:hypothetical protein [Paludibacter sp.]
MIQEINTIQDVELFAFQLVNDESLSFHPDDDFSNYINLETREPLYSNEEVSTLNKQMERCFNICDQFGVDIYELMGHPLLEKLKVGVSTEA